VRTAAKTAAAASERIAVWSNVESQVANMVSPTLQKKLIAYDLAEGVMAITPSRSMEGLTSRVGASQSCGLLAA
jgi:hypothetical protein